MEWVIALLPWLVVYPSLVVFGAWQMRQHLAAEARIKQTMQEHFGQDVTGDANSPGTRFRGHTGDVTISGPGHVMTGVVRSGQMRLDGRAALPDLMVVPEGLRVMLFGMNGAWPIPTGMPAFDSLWKVMPLTGPTGQMAPPGAYVAWARPDVVEALRMLNLPLMQVVSGQLTLTLPSVNVLGVDLALRVMRTITALSHRQSPPALVLPRRPVLASGSDTFGPIVGAGAASVVGLVVVPVILAQNRLIPGSNAIGCPAGGKYVNVCIFGNCSGRHSSWIMYEGRCEIRKATGVTYVDRDPAAGVLEVAWMALGVPACVLVFAGVFFWNAARLAREARALLVQGTRGE